MFFLKRTSISISRLTIHLISNFCPEFLSVMASCKKISSRDSFASPQKEKKNSINIHLHDVSCAKQH